MKTVDWLERHLYTPGQKFGIVLMLAIDLFLFGLVPGALIWGVQMLWIPFWAAGVINGLGHFVGYRNNETEDASTNLFPWGFWIGGEELHNNHHAFPASAKLSLRWWEFDIGWLYIRVFEILGLARVKRAMLIRDAERSVADDGTLSILRSDRGYISAAYRKMLLSVVSKERRDERLAHVRARLEELRSILSHPSWKCDTLLLAKEKLDRLRGSGSELPTLGEFIQIFRDIRAKHHEGAVVYDRDSQLARLNGWIAEVRERSAPRARRFAALLVSTTQLRQKHA